MTTENNKCENAMCAWSGHQYCTTKERKISPGAWEKLREVVSENVRLIEAEKGNIAELEERPGDEYRDKHPAGLWDMHRKINELVKFNNELRELITHFIQGKEL